MTVLIVGAGPAGLACAAQLRHRHIDFELVDNHGSPGGAYSRMYGNLLLASPTAYLSLPGSRFQSTRSHVTVSEYLPYLTQYAETHEILIRQATVARLAASQGGVSVEFADSSSNRYDQIVVATGMSEHPVAPEIPGSTQSSIRIIHSREWPGVREIAGSSVLIVGGGMRAVEISEECASAGIVPLMSIRSRVRIAPQEVGGIDPRFVFYPFLSYLPTAIFRPQCDTGWRYLAVDRGYRRFLAEGKILHCKAIDHINGADVCLFDGSVVHPSLIVFATGFEFHTTFIGSEMTRTHLGAPKILRGANGSLPCVYFLGFPCTFRGDSQFVHGMARDAQKVARAIALARRPGSVTKVIAGRPIEALDPMPLEGGRV